MTTSEPTTPAEFWQPEESPTTGPKWRDRGQIIADLTRDLEEARAEVKRPRGESVPKAEYVRMCDEADQEMLRAEAAEVRAAEALARESRLREAVAALADEWEQSAYRCTKAGDCPVCVTYQGVVIGARRVLASSAREDTPNPEGEAGESQPSFIRPIEVTGDVVPGLVFELSPEQRKELQGQLDAIDEARRSAMRQAHNYVIGRPTPDAGGVPDTKDGE